MELIRLLMEIYEKSYNEEVTLIFQADGSGELVDFYDNNRVHFKFGSVNELKQKLGINDFELNYPGTKIV